MRVYLKALGILSIMCFSFFYTEKVANYMQSKDPLYVSIETVKDDYEVKTVDAIIEDDYIIPGLYGKVVNVQKSFQNMNNYGYFVETYLVYDEVKPDVSLSDNEDKIIKKGNSLKNAVSFIVQDEELIYYFEEMGISYNVLVTKETMNKTYAYGSKINYDYQNYDEVEKYFKSQGISSTLCYLTGGNCEGKTLIEASLSISKSNISSIYKTVSSGDIIYLNDGLGITYLKVLLNQIYFKGLDIVTIEDLISEK